MLHNTNCKYLPYSTQGTWHCAFFFEIWRQILFIGTIVYMWHYYFIKIDSLFRQFLLCCNECRFKCISKISYVCGYTVINHRSTIGCGFLWKYWRKALAQSNPTSKTPNFLINWYGADSISKWTKRPFSFCWVKRLNHHD